MFAHHVEALVCPRCRAALFWKDRAGNGATVETGRLGCTGCDSSYPVLGGVPRFVSQVNYASSFGFEWKTHALTQHDRYSGSTISEDRFFTETMWPRRLDGERILEVGGGAGRFTTHAASTGAMVVSVDLSEAVEVNHQLTGHRENVLIVQADLRMMPVPLGCFDRLYCFGVLQHTPDPEAAFLALPEYLKPGGRLAIDVYRRLEWWQQWTVTKYWVRPLTRRLPPARLYRAVNRYVRIMWPIVKMLRKLPKGRALSWRLLVADYYGDLPLSEVQLREWAVLDTFDMLSPAYDAPQRVSTVRDWFKRAGLTEVTIGRGYNGINGLGARPNLSNTADSHSTGGRCAGVPPAAGGPGDRVNRVQHDVDAND